MKFAQTLAEFYNAYKVDYTDLEVYNKYGIRLDRLTDSQLRELRQILHRLEIEFKSDQTGPSTEVEVEGSRRQTGKTFNEAYDHYAGCLPDGFITTEGGYYVFA